MIRRVLLFAGFLMFCAYLFFSPYEELYAMSARVVELDPERDIVTVENTQGFLWEFYGCEDWEIGDACACVMNDRGTERIFDDKIVSVRYEGMA